MKTLVLCIDRDNDIGVKAGIKSPVIGRAQNLKAATALALRDPEDSDTNAIFAAVSIYDELVKKNVDADIATIAGDINVGITSDHVLTEQLDEVLQKVKADRVYLVSDGVEDSQIYPIVSSRIKVNHVKRVFIKQDKNIESTYYMIVKTFQDEKMRKKIFTPLGMIFAILAIGAIATMSLQMLYPNVWIVKILPGLTLAAIALLLGVYFLNHAYRITENLSKSYDVLRYAIMTSKVSFFSILVAIILVLVGIYYSYSMTSDETHINLIAQIFFENVIIFAMIAGWIYIAGHAFDYYLKRGRIEKSFGVKTVSVIAMGFILYAIASTTRLLVVPDTDMTKQFYIIGIEAGAGLMIGILGALLHHFTKEEADRDARWRL